MKKILLTAAAFAMLAATPAFADDTANIGLSATAGSVCTLSPTQTTVGAVTTPGAVLGAVVFAVDATTGKHSTTLNGSGAALKTVGINCNQKFTVDLASARGAVRIAAASDVPVIGGAFDKAIAYTATPALTGLNSSFTDASTAQTVVADKALTSATDDVTAKTLNVARTVAAGANSGGAYAGDFTVAFRSTASANPLVAGDYSDTLTITLKAAS